MGIISEICKDNAITLHMATDEVIAALGLGEGVKAGFCTKLAGKYRIFLPENSGHYGEVFTAAHELAHILLGHIDPACPANTFSTEAKETEANSFAGAFLALYMMKKYERSDQKEENHMDKLTISVKELAQQLGISKNAAYALANRVDFPSIRVGGRWIIPVDSLKKWLATQAEEKAPCINADQSQMQRA